MYYTAMYVYPYSDISMEWKCKEKFKEIRERRPPSDANTVGLDLRIRKVVFDLLKFNWLQGNASLGIQ
jgi:hypothetical protein